MSLFHSPSKFFPLFAALLAPVLTLAPLSLVAANGTWDGGSVVDGNWTTLANWSGDAAFPGATSGTTNTDIATFNTAIANTWGSSGTPIVIDSSTFNLRGITFDSAAGNYVIGSTGGNSLFLTSGGTILMTNTLANGSAQTINAPIVIVGANGTYTFNNAKNNIASYLTLGGAISGGTAGNTAINFSSAQSASPNAVNGAISNGSSDSLALNHNTGTWSYNGNNTYTGNTTINAGTARFTGNNSGGGDFNINGGANAYFTGTNSYAGTFTLAGGTSTANLYLGSDTVATGSILDVTQIDVTSSRFYLNNVAGNANRLNDAVALTLSGINSIFQLQGNATTDTTETIGALTLGAGYSNIDLTNPTGRITTLNATSLTRDTGFGTAVINTRTLGIGATQSGRIFLSTAPSGIDLVGTGGSPDALNTGIKNLAIVPWLYGSDNAVGRFITYDTVTGLRYLTSNETVATIAAASPAPSETGDNVLLTTTETGVTTKTINSLMLTPGADQAITGAGAGNTLVVSSGALALTAARTSTFSGFDSITFGNSEGVLTTGHANAVLRFDSAIDVTNNGGITKTGAGTLILNTANSYTGTTTINQGTLRVGTGGSTGDLGASSKIDIRGGTTLVIDRTGELEIGSVSGGGTLNHNQTGSVTLHQTATGNTIGTISGVAGSTVAFDGTGTTTVNARLASDDQLIRIDSGTVNLASSRQTAANLEITGGIVNTTDGQFSMRRNTAGTQTLTISGGEFNVINTFGLKSLNSDSWSNSNLTHFIGTQSGGSFKIAGIGSDDFQLGSDFVGATTSYTLSGGLLSYTGTSNFLIGANTAGTSTSTFNLSGGTLQSKGTIQGRNTTNAKQAFVWTGGVLAAAGFDATRLSSTTNTSISASSGTLTNSGGTLAPGDIGVTGRTVITGNYSVTSADAALHIDIAGTSASGTFQDAPGTGRHDSVVIGGASRIVTLGGALHVNLIDGYDGANSFAILTNTGAGGQINGAFTNTFADALGGANRVVLDNGLSSYSVVYNPTNVTLASFVAQNAWSASGGSDWSTAANWAAFAPQSAGHIAKFESTESSGGTVNLDASQTIGGIIFDNLGDSYTISSNNGSSLTIDNTGTSGPSDSAVTVSQGAHQIDVPLALNNHLNVTTTGSTSALTVSGVISGSGKSLTKSGAGILTLSAANTYNGGTTISAGTLLVNNSTGSGTGSGALTIASGATLGGSGFIDSVTTIAGTLSPGNSPGILTFNDAVTLQAGSSVYIEINGSSSRGTDYDGINFNGPLTISGGTLTFNFGAAIADGATLHIFNAGVLTAGFTSVFATGVGDYNGAFSLNVDNTAYTAVFGAQTLTFDLASGDLFVGSTIPEPATYAVLLGAAAILLGLSRRRRTQA